MKLTPYFFRLLLLAMLLVACGAEAPIESEATQITETEPIKANTAVEEPETPNVLTFGDSAVKKMSGLKYEDLTIGQGITANINDIVTIHYTGYLEDGTIFDNSLSQAPYAFLLGAKQVILGWEEGLVGMNVGGKRKLFIPADLAYGELEVGMIPPHSALIFEVEMLDVEPLARPAEFNRYRKRPNGMKMATVQAGDGPEAKMGDLIHYHYNAWLGSGILYDSSSQYEAPVQAILGESALASFDEGIEGMKVGEIRQFRLPPELAYGEEGIENYVPPNSTIIFEVHLLDNQTASTREQEVVEAVVEEIEEVIEEEETEETEETEEKEETEETEENKEEIAEEKEKEEKDAIEEEKTEEEAVEEEEAEEAVEEEDVAEEEEEKEEIVEVEVVQEEPEEEEAAETETEQLKVATSVPTFTAIPTSVPTFTPIPTSVPTLAPKPTSWPTFTPTFITIPTATSAPKASATSVPKASATSKPEASATSKPEVSATSKPEVSATPKPEATATPKPEATATSTSAPISSPAPTFFPTSTPKEEESGGGEEE